MNETAPEQWALRWIKASALAFALLLSAALVLLWRMFACGSAGWSEGLMLAGMVLLLSPIPLLCIGLIALALGAGLGCLQPGTLRRIWQLALALEAFGVLLALATSRAASCGMHLPI